MSTPSFSEPSARRVPLARLVAGLLVSALLFMVLAMVQQWRTFLPLFGVGAAVPRVRPASEAALAEAFVRRFNAALGEAYRTGSPAPLDGFELPAGLREEIVAELAWSRRQRRSPLALAALELISAEARADGWSVTTYESWAPVDGAERPSRLRFRYHVLAEGGALRLGEVVTVLPEPRREAAR